MTLQTRRKTRMYEPWGYQEENDYQSSAGMLGEDLEKFFATAEYNKDDKKIHFFNKDNEEKGTIDVTDFASSVIESATYDRETKILTLVFSNGDVVEIDLGELIDETEFKDGLQVVDGLVSVLIDAESEAFLTVSENGVKISGIAQAIEDAVNDEKARAMAVEGELSGSVLQNAEAIAQNTSAITQNLNAIRTIEQNLNSEISERTRVDNEHDEQINLLDQRTSSLESKATTIEANLNNEIARATSAETALNEAIQAEVARATAAEEANAAAITAEETRATSAETALNEAIQAEVARATSAETALEESISEVGEDKQDKLTPSGCIVIGTVDGVDNVIYFDPSQSEDEVTLSAGTY